MYIGGGTNCRGHKDNVIVQIHRDASFENPLVSYSGSSEIERAFRARLFLHPQEDIKALLECIHVEASGDSVAGIFGCGDEMGHHNLHGHQQQEEEGSLSPFNIGIPPHISPNVPPTVKITYRLTQNYGSFVSFQSMLVVTVQVRSGSSGKLYHSTPGKMKVGLPIATSGFTDSVGHVSQTLVAEVVRIEERWNGVQLLQFAPFHWSRRLNGLVAGGVTYLLFN